LKTILNGYLQKFHRTYIEDVPPLSNAMLNLKTYDYFDIVSILKVESNAMINFLSLKESTAKGFRSLTTQMTFSDLHTRAENFKKIYIDEIASMVTLYGISKEPSQLLDKMAYKIKQLEQDEQKLLEEEKVAKELIALAQEKRKDYLLTSPMQVGQQAPLQIDEGLISSLVQNDYLNNLMKTALNAGVNARKLSVERQHLIKEMERIRSLELPPDRLAEVRRAVDERLELAEKEYRSLLEDITKTNSDFANQEIRGTVRITQEPTTTTQYKKILLNVVIGAILGLMLGLFYALAYESWTRRKPAIPTGT